jgi:hypothetical protein
MLLKEIRLLALVLIFVISLSFSCNSSKSNKDSPQIKSNSYFPVTQGYSWIYSNSLTGENPSTSNVYVKSVVNAGPDKLAQLSLFPFFSDFVTSTKLKIKKTGAIYVVGEDSTENLFLPVNSDMQVGSKWQFAQWSAYIGKADTITTKLGTYTNCLLITYSIAFTFVSEIWLAKDVGIVKWGYNRINPPSLSPSYNVLINMEQNK